MALSVTDVLELYVAMFQRAPEAEGLGYWYAVANAKNLTKAQLANEMAKAVTGLVYNYPTVALNYPEYIGIDVNSMTYDQAKAIINKMYQVLFNKDYSQDPSGIDYWAKLISQDKKSLGEVVVGMIDAAKGLLNSSDPAVKNAAQAFVNKIAVAQYVASQVQKFNGDFGMFQNFIKNVDHSAESIDAAKALVSGTFTKFELTGAYDLLTGTSGDDVFKAAAGTLNVTAMGTDTINGNDGYDVLIADVNASGVQPILISIEELRLKSVQNPGLFSNIDLGATSGLKKIFFDLTAYSGRILNIPSASVDIEIKSVNNFADLRYVAGSLIGDNDAVNLTLAGVEKDSNNDFRNNDVSLISTDAGTGVETLNLKSVVKDNFVDNLQVQTQVQTLVGAQPTLRTLNISGDKNLTISQITADDRASLTVDASGFTGSSLTLSNIDLNGNAGANITASASSDSIGLSSGAAVNGNVNINTGKGADYVFPVATFNINGDLTISTGDDNDTIYIENQNGGATITANNVIVDGGNGNDLIRLTTAGIQSERIVLNKNNTGFDTIVNFDGTEDELAIRGLSNFQIDGTDIDDTGLIVSVSDYSNVSQVLAALNGTNHGLTAGGNGDDNIVVIYNNAGANANAYIYYYFDSNGNGMFDVADNMKLLAVLNNVGYINITIANFV